MKWLYQFLLIIFGGKIKSILLDEFTERRIVEEMAGIENIKEYWELQRLAGYQLFGKTQDRKYLGVVELAETMKRLLEEPIKEPQEKENGGYSSTV